MAIFHPFNKNVNKSQLSEIVRIVERKYHGQCRGGASFNIQRVTDNDDRHDVNKRLDCKPAEADIVVTSVPLIVLNKELFSLDKSLGGGAYGVVFSGTNLMTDEKVAIKKQQYHRCPDHMVQMQCRVTGCHGIGLVHPSIVKRPVYMDDGTVYFVLPLADTVFYKWVNDKLSSPDGWKIVVKGYLNLVDQLEQLHSDPRDPRIHMDLKGDNILVVDDTAYLADFGCSKQIGILVDLVPANYQDYRHNAPEYFINRPIAGGIDNPPGKYLVSGSFDVYSLGFVISSDIDKFPLWLRKDLEAIGADLQNLDPKKRPTLGKVREYLKFLLDLTESRVSGREFQRRAEAVKRQMKPVGKLKFELPVKPMFVPQIKMDQQIPKFELPAGWDAFYQQPQMDAFNAKPHQPMFNCAGQRFGVKCAAPRLKWI